MKPIKTRIRKWVEALRSGKYRQTQQQLRDDSGAFCCLGVACEVYRKATKKGKWTKENAFLGNEEVLPIAVQNYFGIDENPTLIENDEYYLSYDATDLNDQKDYSFKQIADAIEKKYLK